MTIASSWTSSLFLVNDCSVCCQVDRDSNIRLVRFLWAHHSSLLLDLVKNSADMVLPLSNLGNFLEFTVSDVCPGSDFYHTGSRTEELTRSRIRIRILVKEFMYFLTQKTDSKYSKIWSGMFRPDLGFWYWIFSHPRFRTKVLDPGVKKHRIPDPQHLFKISCVFSPRKNLRWQI